MWQSKQKDVHADKLLDVVDLTEDDEDELKPHLSSLDKLFQEPIVYTTKLEDMPMFRKKRYLEYSKRQCIINMIRQSKPTVIQNNFNPGQLVEKDNDSFKQLKLRLKTIFDPEGIGTEEEDEEKPEIDSVIYVYDDDDEKPEIGSLIYKKDKDDENPKICSMIYENDDNDEKPEIGSLIYKKDEDDENPKIGSMLYENDDDDEKPEMGSEIYEPESTVHNIMRVDDHCYENVVVRNNRLFKMCKPMSIILGDFRKSKKLLEDITKTGIKFRDKSLKIIPPFTLSSSFNFNSPSSTAMKVLKKNPNRLRNGYWLLWDKRGKTYVWDLYFITKAGTVNFSITNQSESRAFSTSTSVLNDPTLRPVTETFCCWFKRRNFLSSMYTAEVISFSAALIMAKLHACTECVCCCRKYRQDCCSQPAAMANPAAETSHCKNCITPYDAILKKLSKNNKPSLINTALKFNIPPLKSTRENTKLKPSPKNINFFTNITDKKNNEANITKQPEMAPTCKQNTINSKQISTKPHVPQLVELLTQIPNSNESSTQDSSDIESLIPRHETLNPYTLPPNNDTVKSKSDSKNTQKAPCYVNIRPKSKAANSKIVPLAFDCKEGKRRKYIKNNIQKTTPSYVNIRPKPGSDIESLSPGPAINAQQVVVTVPQINKSQLPIVDINSHDEVVKTIVQTILETFENVHLSIDKNGKVAAVLPKPVQNLSTAELKILNQVLRLAQKQVSELNLNPGAVLKTNINFVNEAELLNSMSAANNIVKNFSIAFNASVRSDTCTTILNQVEPIAEERSQELQDFNESSTPFLPLPDRSNMASQYYEVPSLSEETILPNIKDPSIKFPKIENVFSLQQTIECLKQDLNIADSDSISIVSAQERDNEEYLTEEEIILPILHENDDAVNKEIDDIEKQYEERKRKCSTPETKPQSKIRIVSPSKLGIPKHREESCTENDPWSNYNVIIIPPDILNKLTSETGGLLNGNLSQPTIRPVILNHQLDNGMFSQNTVSAMSARSVFIDEKGEIIEPIKTKIKRK